MALKNKIRNVPYKDSKLFFLIVLKGSHFCGYKISKSCRPLDCKLRHKHSACWAGSLEVFAVSTQSILIPTLACRSLICREKQRISSEKEARHLRRELPCGVLSDPSADVLILLRDVAATQGSFWYLYFQMSVRFDVK